MRWHLMDRISDAGGMALGWSPFAIGATVLYYGSASIIWKVTGAYPSVYSLFWIFFVALIVAGLVIQGTRVFIEVGLMVSWRLIGLDPSPVPEPTGFGWRLLIPSDRDLVLQIAVAIFFTWLAAINGF